MYNKTIKALIITLTAYVFCACTYEETFTTVPVSVRLVYPANTIEPYKGVRVELKDARASICFEDRPVYGARWPCFLLYAFAPFAVP